jgi:hypothetical protein
MIPDFFKCSPGNNTLRILSLVYGLIFFNIGALVLFEKISESPILIDEKLGWGALCLVLGLVGLMASRRFKQRAG